MQESPSIEYDLFGCNFSNLLSFLKGIDVIRKFIRLFEKVMA